MHYWLLAAVALIFLVLRGSGIKLLGATNNVINRTSLNLTINGRQIGYYDEGSFNYGDEIKYQGQTIGYFEGKNLGQITEAPDPYKGLVIENKYPIDMIVSARTMHGEWNTRVGVVRAGETAKFPLPELEVGLYIDTNIQKNYRIQSANKLIYSIQ